MLRAPVVASESPLVGVSSVIQSHAVVVAHNLPTKLPPVGS